DEILKVRLGTETTAVRRDIPIPVEREHLLEPLFEVRQVESGHVLEENTLDRNPVDREDEPLARQPHQQHVFGVIPAQISQFQIVPADAERAFVLNDLIDRYDVGALHLRDVSLGEAMRHKSCASILNGLPPAM